MNPIPLIRQAAIAPAVSYLAAEGVPVGRYLRRAKLSIPLPETLETLIPLHQMCDFLSSVARAEGIRDLGFRIGGHVGIECLGVYGRLFTQSLTLHECIQTSIDLISSFNSGQQIWLERHGDEVRYCQKIIEHSPPDRVTEVIHLGFAIALVCPRHALGPNWKPNRIELASDPVDLTVHYSELANVPSSFSQPHTSIWADLKVLSAPLPRWDARELPPAGETDRASFVESGPAVDFAGQLEQAIASALDRPEMGLQLTAAIIGMSSRTIQRRLGELGLSFSHLVQGVRFQNAQGLLRDSQMPLVQIAKRLGYTDPANFTRAFKRWTGISPNEFRRIHYEDGHE